MAVLSSESASSSSTEILAQHVSARLYLAEVSYSSIHWFDISRCPRERQHPPNGYGASYLLYSKGWNGRHRVLDDTGFVAKEQVQVNSTGVEAGSQCVHFVMSDGMRYLQAMTRDIHLSPRGTICSPQSSCHALGRATMTCHCMEAASGLYNNRESPSRHSTIEQPPNPLAMYLYSRTRTIHSLMC